MRSPEKEAELTVLGARMKIMPLDVTDAKSVTVAFESAIATFGSIDVVVNNAGYGLVGVLEAMTYEQVNRQIQTNVTGLIEVSRQAAKLFRVQKSGVLINVASVVGKVAVPLYNV